MAYITVSVFQADKNNLINTKAKRCLAFFSWHAFAADAYALFQAHTSARSTFSQNHFAFPNSKALWITKRN